MTALIQLLRRWPDRPQEIPVLAALDPAGLVAEAGRHGLSGLVQHALDRSGARMPDAEAEQLRRDALGIRAASVRVKRLLGRSVDALAAAGIVPVVLKGVPLAERLYGDAGHRASTDVDLWVPPSGAAAAQRALESLGLRASAHREPHHLELHGPEGLVELHLYPMAPFGEVVAGGAFRDRAVEAQSGGHRHLRLAPDDEMLYLAAHATNHLLQRLAWVYDLKLLARAEPALDWDRLLRTAAQTGTGALAYYALDAAARLLDAAIPARVLYALRPSRWQAAAARRLFSEQLLASAYLAGHRSAWVAAKVVLAPRPRKLLGLAWRRLRGG
ncbi:MAG TPA: nucleotidyltransferase family protein [Myxococcales bacterium]|nr:nucleotidyltransferase family protein [Myxococcales bacterium]